MNIATQIQIELSGSDIADILTAHVLKELHVRNLISDTSSDGNAMTVTHNGNGSVSMAVATGTPFKPNMIADAASKFDDAPFTPDTPKAKAKVDSKAKADALMEKASKANAKAKTKAKANKAEKAKEQADIERVRKERNDAVVANADKNYREKPQASSSASVTTDVEDARSKQTEKANALIAASAKAGGTSTATNNPFQVVPDTKVEPSKIIKEAAERKLAESADPDAAVGIDALKEQLDAPKNNFVGKTNNPFQVA